MRQASRQGPGGKPVIALDSTQLASLQRVVGPSLPSPLSIERFLGALSGTALEHCSGEWPNLANLPPLMHRRRSSPPPRLSTAPPGVHDTLGQVEQVVQILKLADWFGAHELRDRCDSRLCQLLHGLSNRQAVSDSREEAAAQALEAGIQHYLTKTVGWLLPWALQQLSRGDKDCPGAAAAEQLSGELRTGQQHSAWFLHRAARRRRRLHEALMGDDQLKVVLMEQQWWAQGDDFEAGCADCGCSPSDLRPAYDCTGEAWLWSRDGSSYMAAAAHFAHLLHERCWGLTPAGSGFCSGPLAISPRDQAPAPQGLVRMGSMSSVGQHH
ncbi:expressed protein [Chlorella variabilis]|uniref:Expressed protein n=1 Tax=Chlorella variabilis TaxID=554065 RepID=E1Z3D9_CHLVA|nr:expressed protein [Chlorella variabilis]EFN59827.1 expressed protein [Chlorella variabilis]|eukprot:XP_005851929.1 expressed protein [Chlorella variabilis]